MTIAGEQAPVRTIGHYEVAHRNVLADEPQLRGVIDNELLYGLRLVEDDQILNGNGSGNNLQGIIGAVALTHKHLDQIHESMQFERYHQDHACVLRTNWNSYSSK
ncbi:MAG: hypothetical protein CM15mV33_750 [uncultured marine virus]|nr:MAG: hypothetical protein CM15mV33_750 [uncultured marine virus]